MERISNIINELELDSYVGTYEGKDFLVVSSWNEHAQIEKALGNSIDSEISNDWGFDDEYSTCSRCNKIVRISPDSYSWLPDYVDMNCERICHECLNIEDYFEFISNNPKNANTIYKDTDIIEQGYELLGVYESGWDGVNTRPVDIYNRYKDDYESIIFSIFNQEQFRTEYSAWGKGKIEIVEDEE